LLWRHGVHKQRPRQKLRPVRGYAHTRVKNWMYSVDYP
jgi:hypothetical protein